MKQIKYIMLILRNKTFYEIYNQISQFDYIVGRIRIVENSKLG